MEWDVFISHASEDKDAIARPLANALRSLGNRVWFDEFTLSLGDSLRRSIDHGLGSSRFGVVVISPAFIEQEWPKRELDALYARETDGEKVIIPLWHNVTFNDVKKFSPLLLDRLAVTSDIGTERAAEKINSLVIETKRFEQERARQTERLEEERARQRIPSPVLHEKVSSRHLVLESTSWRADWLDTQFGQRVYRFDIVLNASSEVLDRITKVTYLLPPAWPTSPADIADRQSRFRLRELTWADLFARAKVYVRDQDEVVDVSCHVGLQEAGPQI
jgi:hypothetical protein